MAKSAAGWKRKNPGWPKCQHCKSELGDLEYEIVGEVVAYGEYPALDLYNKGEYKDLRRNVSVLSAMSKGCK